MGSLWGEEFVIKESPKQTKKIINKISKPKEPKIQTVKDINKKGVSIQNKLNLIYSEVDRILGHYKGNTLVIRDIDVLHNYIDKAIRNNIIAIDTETNNSLDPLTCKLMGPCLYTPGMKNAYIPMHHVDLLGNELDNQITEEQFAEELKRLSNTKIIMHNGKFDYEVIKCTCGVELDIYWDTLIGSRILNENERRAGLKYQYIDKIDATQEKYDIEHLFEKMEYAIVDPTIFALYAATDSYMTYKLYEWQKNEFAKPDNKKLYNLFMNIEMPMVKVTAEMELTGVCLDLDYAKRLSDKYHKLVDEVDKSIQNELTTYSGIISKWRNSPEANIHLKSNKINKKGEYSIQKSKNEQLSDPPEVTSPLQLAIFLYDVLKIPPISKKTPRGTGEDILKKIDLPVCKLILKKRGLEKLIGTYIDKLPECISSKDGRLHAGFNQIGADTGRFSSSNPNLQNIPSHNNEIRMMFIASPGYVMVGSDYSAQEPRLFAAYSQDPALLKNYEEGKDLYCTVASVVYNNKYEDNLEFNSDGSFNPAGKERRSSCKSLILGLMYGRGIRSIADQIKNHPGDVTQDDIKRAEEISNKFFSNFPVAKKWMDETSYNAKINGYVEDLWGRRRRLPDLQLPKYAFKYIGSYDNFNPLFGCHGTFLNDTSIFKKYEQRLSKGVNLKQYEKIKAEALKENIEIINNGGFIAQAERQCVNARIQGGAATMTKRALLLLYNDSEMQSLGFRILFPVHDEIIGECPIENVERVKERLSELMVEAGKPECVVPMKCDADSFSRWYEDVYSAKLKEEYSKEKEKDSLNALQNIILKHSELTESQIKDILL